MKIIRPEQPIKKEQPKEEKLTLIIDGHEVTQFTKDKVEQTFNPNEELIDDNTGKDQTIEKIMDDIIAEKTTLLEDKYQVTVYLTERQYNLWKKKGGEKWLKRALVGQQKVRKSNKTK